jgi:hypothetical protein
MQHASRAYWARLSPEERSAEIKRRAVSRAQNAEIKRRLRSARKRIRLFYTIAGKALALEALISTSTGLYSIKVTPYPRDTGHPNVHNGELGTKYRLPRFLAPADICQMRPVPNSGFRHWNCIYIRSIRLVGKSMKPPSGKPRMGGKWTLTPSQTQEGISISRSATWIRP